MDYLAVALLGLFALDFALVALALVLGGQAAKSYARYQESARQAAALEAHNKMLEAQVLELKDMMSGADWEITKANRNFLKARSEVKRLKRLVKGM